MFHSRWLHNLFGLSSSRKDRRRHAAQNRKQVRLMLEALEERLTPSGGTVTQTAGGYTALTKAVGGDTAASTNYVINITSNFTFASGGQVTISKLGKGSTLAIDGQNGTVYTLTGNGNRLFDIVNGNVSFKDLILTGGSITNNAGAAQGGGILENGGSVLFSDATVSNCSVVTGASSAQGGGIFVSGGGALTIQGAAIVQGNKATCIGSSTFAGGGGVYVSGASKVTIADSVLSNNSAVGGNGANATLPGAFGSAGINASGGGLYVNGAGWTVTLKGDTLSGNSAVGGNGGTGGNGFVPGGSGGDGGAGGSATGGAAAFNVTGANDSLTILNDLNAPTTQPSTFLGNSVQGGNGGTGGNGGLSVGLPNSRGGDGGVAGIAEGGAVALLDTAGATFTANMGNTTLYGNKVSGGNGGAGGAAGTGGTGGGVAGTSQIAGAANGGGLFVVGGSVTLVNSTVANNTVTAGVTGGTKTQGAGSGGGVYDSTVGTALALDNNTITQNNLNAATGSLGSGIAVGNPAATLVNNLIVGNQSTATSANNLDVVGAKTLSGSTNNFVASMSANALSTTTNTIGNTQAQLGGIVGIANGKPSGGPIFYPLLPGAASVQAGTTSVLTTIAGVEGTTTANATDEIGNLRSTNGTIGLGAVQLNPVLASSPTSQTVTAGTTVTFTASAASTLTPTTVQWQFSSNGGATFTNISGATSITLTLKNVTTAMNGYKYQAVFTNNGVSATTPAATLSVNAAPPPPPSPPPAPPTLNVPPLLAFFDALLGGVETVNSNGTETITDRFFGFPLLVSTFNSSGNLMSVDLFGVIDVTMLFELIP